MSIFAGVGSTSLGPVAAGWIEANSHLQWLRLIVTALCLVLLVLFMRETRTSVILSRRAKKLRAETGDDRYRSVAEVELPSLKTLFIISCTRPLRLLSHALTATQHRQPGLRDKFQPGAVLPVRRTHALPAAYY
ncbi:hypothetical protein FA95DRAFT_1614275 [Auriscalpium vulgare]|uniref:Uncharacterized protein n=1 Tax=Auriscalpium vulgare TaxID=40419 RepID=A0ACB8R003_9AGAM|nr:hypothetical protein FA95DRAFT_1614275 [Auriscalpium vulgare]